MFKKLGMATLGAAALLAAIPAAASADRFDRHTQYGGYLKNDGYAERGAQEHVPQQYATPVYHTPGYGQVRDDEARQNDRRQDEWRENERREHDRGGHDRGEWGYNSRRDNDDRNRR